MNENFSDEAKTNELKMLHENVDAAINNAPIFDMHTHLFPAQFGDLNSYGIDELLNYHYLIAELFRYEDIAPDDFYAMEKEARSDLIWRKLFVESSPISEATRGVISVLDAYNLDVRAENLSAAREFFRAQKPEDFIGKVLEIANVSDVVMTNDPLDEAEINVWNGDEKIDARFHAALRLDQLLNGWTEAAPLMRKQNYAVAEDVSGETISETRRFLDDWIAKMKPLYLGASLPDDFVYPENSLRGKLFKEVIFPTCKAHKISLALMIGVRRQVNPALKLAGDGVGRADVSAVGNLRGKPGRENSFDVSVARKSARTVRRRP